MLKFICIFLWHFKLHKLFLCCLSDYPAINACYAFWKGVIIAPSCGYSLYIKKDFQSDTLFHVSKNLSLIGLLQFIRACDWLTVIATSRHVFLQVSEKWRYYTDINAPLIVDLLSRVGTFKQFLSSFECSTLSLTPKCCFDQILVPRTMVGKTSIRRNFIG